MSYFSSSRLSEVWKVSVKDFLAYSTSSFIRFWAQPMLSVDFISAIAYSISKGSFVFIFKI